MTRRDWWAMAAAGVVAALGLSLAPGLRADPPLSTPAGRATAGPATVERDAPAPPLAGPTLAGGRFDLTRLRGNVVLVNVWATWCAPCTEELPLLVAAARRWSGEGLRVVGLNIRDDPDRARDLLAELGAGGLTVVPDPRGAVAVAWGVHGVPETFLVDRGGHVRVSARGVVTAEWLEQRVPPLLAS